MTEKRRAPLEVLERLAEADVALTDAVDGKEGVSPALYERLFADRCAALAAYRAATAQLRTRAEVDAEIAATCRAATQIPAGKLDVMALNRLCSESTTDEPETGAATTCTRCREPDPRAR